MSNVFENFGKYHKNHIKDLCNKSISYFKKKTELQYNEILNKYLGKVIEKGFLFKKTQIVLTNEKTILEYLNKETSEFCGVGTYTKLEHIKILEKCFYDNEIYKINKILRCIEHSEEVYLTFSEYHNLVYYANSNDILKEIKNDI